MNIYLDSAAVTHFKTLADARGYQTLINEALKNAMQAEGIKVTVRHAIQQELKSYKICKN